MIGTIILLFRSFIVLIFGVAVCILFAGVPRKSGAKMAIILFIACTLFLQILCWRMLGLEITLKLYPFIAH